MKNHLLLLSVLFLISCGKEEPTPEPTKYNVSISLNPTDGGEVNPNGGQFLENQTVTLIVNSNDGFEFLGWSGSWNGSENPLTLTIDGNKSLTVNFRELDGDKDGIEDDVDNCLNTPEGETVDEYGCSDSQKDTDGDGVVDSVDLDNNTREGVPVDENGVMLNPIYLDENGVTIKSHDWGIVGDVGLINDEEYTIVGDLSNFDFNNKIVTTLITDMSGTFRSKTVNGDISSWDVSNVTDIGGMFYNNKSFNGDISSWDVSNVTNMVGVFGGSSFTGDISSWDVSSVNDMDMMFRGSVFNGDISSWDVSNVRDMSRMFENSQFFNQDLSNWDVSNVSRCFFFSLNTPQWTLPKPNLPCGE